MCNIKWEDSFRLRTLRRTFHVMVNSGECVQFRHKTRFLLTDSP